MNLATLLKHVRIGLISNRFTFLETAQSNEFVKCLGLGQNYCDFNDDFNKPRSAYQALVAIGWNVGSDKILSYNPRSHKWCNITEKLKYNMDDFRGKTCDAVIYAENALYLLQGSVGQSATLRFDFETENWTEVDSKRNKRRFHFAYCKLGRFVYIMGGYTTVLDDDDLTEMKSTDRFSLADQQWESVADMNHGREDPSACACELYQRGTRTKLIITTKYIL